MPPSPKSSSGISIPGLKPPQPFHITGNTESNWRLFKQRWETYSVLTDLSSHDDKLQVALFTSCLADDALQVFNGFTGSKKKIADIIDQFETFAVGEQNVIYERFLFNRRAQEEGESFEHFLSDLRNMVLKCDYCSSCVDSLVRDRIVLGIRDRDTQTELLKCRALTLKDCIDRCKASESAAKQTHVIRPMEEVSAIRHNFDPTPNKNIRECRFCGGNHPFKREACPAYNKKCMKCQKMNHFARKCLQTNQFEGSRPRRSAPQQIRQITQSDSDEADFVNTVERSGSAKDIKCKLAINGTALNFLIDTGVSVNLLPQRFASNITQSQRRLKMWNGSVVTPLGESKEMVKNPKSNRAQVVNFVICDNQMKPVIGLSTSQELGLVHICEENFERVNLASSCETNNELKKSAKNIGAFPGYHTLKLSEGTQPKIIPNRRIPVAIRDEVKTELDRLIQLGVISPVSKPTQWLSQMVVVKKKNSKLRVCIDPCELNKALERERYPLPILEDVLHELIVSQGCFLKPTSKTDTGMSTSMRNPAT